MSLNLITVPNEYNLFCSSITQENPDEGNSLSLSVTVLPAQPLVASPAIALSSMAIRGVASTPPNGPPITMNLMSDNFNNLVTMVIPQFSLIAWTGSATVFVLSLRTSLPAQFLPIYNTEWVIPFHYSSNPVVGQTTYLTGPAILQLDTVGNITIVGNFVAGTAATQPFGPQANGPVGPTADIYVQYTAVNIPV